MTEEDKIQQTSEEFKLPREISNIATFLTAIVNIISALSVASGKITLEIGLLIVIPVLVTYLVWMFYKIKRSSIIDWGKFYKMLVLEKAKLEYTRSFVKGPAYDKLLTDEVYNNYIAFLYLAALYEGKEKFAQELWDKARILDTFDAIEDEQKNKEKKMIQAHYAKVNQ
ncbi:MAG: hypothetical protein ABOK23_05445 [Candidatus Methanoperedens sp.]|nr:hypothetical protein [Candidatus Methanoperedens sp.]MCZ7394972.1 hypothetical protein [Candidatus Methanoperedens sp.]